MGDFFSPSKSEPDGTCLDVMRVEVKIHGTGNIIIYPGNDEDFY